MRMNNLLTDTVTYWGTPQPDGYGGKTFAAPVTVKARWVKKQERFLSPDGEELISNAVVYLDHDVEAGGYLYLGTSAQSSPYDEDGAREIAAFEQGRSIRDAQVSLTKVMVR